MRTGTVPRSATANATSVASPRKKASTTYPQLAFLIESQNSAGSPMRENRNPMARSALTAMSS